MSPARVNSQGPSLWLAAPAIVLFVAFAVVPLLGVVGLSCMTWDGLGSPEWAGLSHWQQVLTDPTTHNALGLSLVVVLVSWAVQTPLSILLGAFMAGHQRYRAVLAVMYFLPLLFSAAAVGIAFKALLDPNFGLSRAFHLQALAQDWLGSPALALSTVLVIVAWCFIPFHALLYQGAVRQIPTSMLEAAKLDGVGRVKTFFHITLPQIRNTVITSSTLMIVGSLTYFDLIFVMTNGGPGNATRILPLDMYLRGFRAYDMGGAAVLGVIVALLGLLVSYLLNRMAGTSRMDSQMEGA